MKVYNLFFKATNAHTNEVCFEGIWDEFYASSQAEANECAKDIIVSVYDYQEKYYRVDFTSDTSANVFFIADGSGEPVPEELDVIVTDIKAIPEEALGTL